MLENDSESQNPPYEVGHGKPPKQTRFKKGVSGNPRGRVKGTRNYHTDISEVLSTPVPASKKGKRRYITARQANLVKLCALALSGNIRAIQLLDGLARLNDSVAHQQAAAGTITEATDRVLIERAVARWARTAAAIKEGKPTTESEVRQNNAQSKEEME